MHEMPCGCVLEKMKWSPLPVTVSLLSLLSEGRLGFTLQSFRHIHRTQIAERNWKKKISSEKNNISALPYTSSIPKYLGWANKRLKPSENIIFLKFVQTDYVIVVDGADTG